MTNKINLFTFLIIAYSLVVCFTFKDDSVDVKNATSKIDSIENQQIIVKNNADVSFSVFNLFGYKLTSN